jgi:hypothetical protein
MIMLMNYGTEYNYADETPHDTRGHVDTNTLRQQAILH